MAFTTDDIAALETAIKGGELRVKYGDKEVWYRSLDEMLRLLAIMKKDSGVTTGGAAALVKTPTFSKGLR